MPSPLPPQLPSSHASSTSLSHRAQQHRKTSTDKPGLVKRNSSTSSLHRSMSSKSNTSAGATKTAKHHHHAHVAHTSASKHNRTTSFGHRVPSYGKGLNKLTALTTAHPDEAPKQHLSVHSIVDRQQGGTSMQRSLSEGNALARTDRRQSGSSVHSSRPRVRRPTTGTTTRQNKQHVTFSTKHSSDEDEDDEPTAVHRKSDEIVASPLPHTTLHHQGLQQPHHHISPAPSSMIHTKPGHQKSALKEGLSSPAPKFLQKNLSQVALVPPKVSITNAVSKDLTKPATSVEHVYSDNGCTPSSEPQVPPSSNPTSHFISSTPPSRTPRTPDLDMTGLRRNQSSTSLAPTDQGVISMTSTSGKLTRTQQKLLLQRASTQPPQGPLNLTTSYSSPSLALVQHMESAPDYFSPMPPTPTFSAPGQTNMTYDVKVAREFERISRELINAKRFGDPTGDAVARLRDRVNPGRQGSLAKKQSAFGLSMAWKRSPAKHHEGGRARVDGDDVFGGERKSKVREIIRRLWFDEIDVSDVMGGGMDDDADDGEEQVTLKSSRRRGSAQSQ